MMMRSVMIEENYGWGLESIAACRRVDCDIRRTMFLTSKLGVGRFGVS